MPGLRFSEHEILATEAGKDPINIAKINALCDTPKKRNKYNAVKKEVDGIVFDSTKEARRYQELKYMQAAGEISDLECHPRYDLFAGITYKPDFRYVDGGRVVVEDVKGGKATRTRDFIMRWKMANEIYTDVDWRIT